MTLNILVVDDSDTVRAVICKTLGLAGVPVGELYQAANGQEALEIMGANWIDLVFSDINMPVMGGIEMIETMEKNDMMESIPVVVISTEGSKRRIEELKNKGIRAYIRKPFTPERVREVVDDIIGADDGNGL